MTAATKSPFAKPEPSLRIKEGSPPLLRPTREEIDTFPTEAKNLVHANIETQKACLTENLYDLNWLEGRHVLIAGGTGPGLGCALATAVLGQKKAASLTVIAKDLSRSINFETGKMLQHLADENSWGKRFHWIPDGMALEGIAFDKLVTALKEAEAGRVVYFNAVAAAISGLQPGMPPVYIKDLDAEGLFQWQLKPLTDKEVQITRYVMGELAVQFPQALHDQGIAVEISVFSDWRGSRDYESRDPSSAVYGRQGAYSTSLYLPKDVIHDAVSLAFGTPTNMIDVFLPIMRTRALPFIPGGMFMAGVYDKLMKQAGVKPKGIPELALGVLEVVGKNITHHYSNPFPRFDAYEAQFDDWFFEVATRLSNDKDSDFFYQNWL